jgi:hypothetical protein
MASDYYTPNTTLREPTDSIIPHVTLYIIQFIALASPPFLGRRLLFSSLIIVLAIQAHRNPHFTNTIALAQPFTIAWSYYMATLAKLLFSSDPGPESEYWRIDKPEKEALSYTAFLWKKLVWATMLVFNQRGVRWNHQVKNVPTVPQQSKARFLLYQALRFLMCLMTADLLFELTRRFMFTSPDGTVGQINSKYLTMRHSDPRWSFAKAFVFGATPYFMLSMQYAQFAFIAVLLGLSTPEVRIHTSHLCCWIKVLICCVGLAFSVRSFERNDNSARLLGKILASAATPHVDTVHGCFGKGTAHSTRDKLLLLYQTLHRFLDLWHLSCDVSASDAIAHQHYCPGTNRWVFLILCVDDGGHHHRGLRAVDS